MGAPITTEVVVERIWGEQAPPQARDVLYTHITRLRGVLRGLGGAEVVNVADGYQSRVELDQVDAHRFTRLAAAAAASGPARNPAARLAGLREALALWRGEPMAGVTGAWIERSRQRLRSQWLVRSSSVTTYSANESYSLHEN